MTRLPFWVLLSPCCPRSCWWYDQWASPFEYRVDSSGIANIASFCLAGGILPRFQLARTATNEERGVPDCRQYHACRVDHVVLREVGVFDPDVMSGRILILQHEWMAVIPFHFAASMSDVVILLVTAFDRAGRFDRGDWNQEEGPLLRNVARITPRKRLSSHEYG